MRTFSYHKGIDAFRQQSWSWLLRHVVLPMGDLAFHQGLIKRLRFLEHAQWWAPERLYAYRDRSLQDLVKTVYQDVPLYRELMDNAGVKPDDVRNPQELHKLPVVTKEMLRCGYPQRCTRKTGQKTYEVSTSGSTGANFFVQTDAETAGYSRAAHALVMAWAGWRLGEPFLQTGMTLQRSFEKWLKDVILRCHYVSAFDLSDARLDQSLEVLEQHAIEHLYGYPGSLYFLARRALEKGWNQPLRAIVTWGDTLYPHYRETIELAFKTRVFDTYGTGEGPMQIAAQCEQMRTYHLHTLDVIVEFLDDAGYPASPTQSANLIVTRLHPGPMPLIRYQVGDVGIAGEFRMCECGRGFDTMESVQGRDTDVVITPSGNRLIVHFFTGILEHFREVHSFQVIQDKPGSILVRVVPTEDFSHEVAGQIVSKLQERGAADMEIEIEPTRELPLPPSGKRRFVISEVAKSRRLGTEKTDI